MLEMEEGIAIRFTLMSGCLEIHFPPFIACINRGGSRSVMTAYNSPDGSPATANHWLLNKKVKDEWQFKGYNSDAAATGGANV
jgi:beta-glucosidase